MEAVEMENKPTHVNEDGLERDEAVTEKLVAQSDGTKITFTNSKADGKDRNGDAKIDIKGVESQFVGLSKEELMKYANDPFWVRLRMTLFVLFWVLWLAMLVGAVAIIVLTPRCAPPPRLAWWQSSPVYSVDVDTYSDSNGDGRGDIAGLTSKLEYIKQLGMRTLLLSDIFAKDASGAVTDYLEVRSSLGTLADVEALLNSTKEKDLHVVLEINPAYTSTDHQWFLDSSEGKDGFQDIYIWEQGDEASPPDGVGRESRALACCLGYLCWHLDKLQTVVGVNYQSGEVTSGVTEENDNMASGESAWTYNAALKAFYLHQTSLDSADINWKSPKALELFTGVLRFWLERGVSGFLVSHTYLDHAPVLKQATFATEQDVLGVLKEWRQVLGNYSSTHETEHRVLGVRVDKVASEAKALYGSSDELAADLVLSKPFEQLVGKPGAASLRGFVQETLDVTPEGMWPSFVLGSASSSRLKERAGMLLDGLHMVAALVQGTPVFYNGDELALECLAKQCIMPWAEEGADNPVVGAQALSSNSSHLEVVRHSTELRDKLAVRLGTTVTSVLGANSTVFVMLRVRKGTPGYMVVVNGDHEQVTVNLADASSHIPESGHIEVKSSNSTKVVQSKVKLNEFTLDAHEAVIMQFVPIFE